LNTAAIKSGELSDGLKQLGDGSNSLNSGLKDANDGADKLRDGLNSGYDKMSDKLNFSSDDMSKFVSEPISLKNNSINDVKYYGEGFGPYFISLSLWIGIMLMNIIFSIEKSLKLFKNKFLNSFIGKFIIGSGLVSIQALILSFVLVKVLGINPVNITSFYISNIFIAIVFFSIMHGVSHAIGFIGAPIMFIVLLLQLASSGGTFPIETAPAFYQAIGKIIPMTYSVNTLRMIISGINSSLLSHNIVILMIFMVVSLCGGVLTRLIIDRMKKKEQVIDNSQTI
jgi:putative membrane protein